MCYQLTELQADELITSIKEMQEDKQRFEKMKEENKKQI